MSEYIDRDVLLRKKHGCDRKDCATCDFFTDGDSWCQGELFAIDVLYAPAADVVEVVRCEKCKYLDYDGELFCGYFQRGIERKDFFCAHGEMAKDG